MWEQYKHAALCASASGCLYQNRALPTGNVTHQEEEEEEEEGEEEEEEEEKEEEKSS